MDKMNIDFTKETGPMKDLHGVNNAPYVHGRVPGSLRS